MCVYYDVILVSVQLKVSKLLIIVLGIKCSQLKDSEW